MQSCVFAFSKPAEGSKVASARIAHYIAKELKLPLVWDATVASEPLETLIIVNGAFAFCDCLPAIGAAVRAAKHVIWVQNDYTIVPPKITGGATSPFRAAFVQRAEAGLPHYDLWSTIAPAPAYARSKFNRYINWNALTYDYAPVPNQGSVSGGVLYYGAYRQNREPAFYRYIRKAVVRTQVFTSAPSKFYELCRYGSETVDVLPSIPENMMRQVLSSAGLGLYIEDEKSHTEFHSPANRFYEMLSAELPMVFQPESAANLLKAGIDVSDFVVADGHEVATMLRKRAKLQSAQRAWHAVAIEHKEEQLNKALRRAWREHQKRFA